VTILSTIIIIVIIIPACLLLAGKPKPFSRELLLKVHFYVPKKSCTFLVPNSRIVPREQKSMDS
jgi:galactitol-specific phosphotransferase system IIC component